MSAELANEIWIELKRYLSPVDKAEAADNLVAILIDNDFDANDIKDAFNGDKDIRTALQSYLNDDDDLESEDDHDQEFDDNQ